MIYLSKLKIAIKTLHYRDDLISKILISELSQTERIIYSAAEFLMRRERLARPWGFTSPDNIWYPFSIEVCSCCEKVVEKGFLKRYTLLTHCKTIGHIAELYNCPANEVRKMIQKKYWPCLIHIDPLLDISLANHFRISATVK